MIRKRSTKIIGTLGPASASPHMIEQLFLQGVDVFRLNFSHGTKEDHEKRIHIIRELSKKYDYPIAILQDLQGPKLRIGTFEKGAITLSAGDNFIFDMSPKPGDQQRVNLPHPEVFQALKPGMNIMLNDGRLCMKVETMESDRMVTQVISGGMLSNHKGVNVPDVLLPISALTEKDRQDLAFGQQFELEYVALSFVQRPEDVRELRSLLTYPSKIASKIEKPSAMEHLDAIIKESDAIMVARGDLGVEMLPEEVPRLQREIIQSCRRAACPVVVATQMLESMVTASTPTRAEVSDVATAVYAGADAVMLSAESASGENPEASVAMMDRIIKNVESDPSYRVDLRKSMAPDTLVEHPARAIAEATDQVAHTVQAKAIITLTEQGGVAQRASYKRPEVPILALTPSMAVARSLCLYWGVHPHVVAKDMQTDKAIAFIESLLRQEYGAQDGDHMVITASAQFLNNGKQDLFETGATRVLRIITLGDMAPS